MKFIPQLIYLPLAALLSCGGKTDIKTFSDGKITVEAFTAIRPEVQSSDRNICIIKAKKEGEAEVIVSYSSYGLNNVDIGFKERQIIIKPLDPATADELKNATEKASRVLGYAVVFQE